MADKEPSANSPTDNTKSNDNNKAGFNEPLLATDDINQSIIEAGKKIFDFINNLQSGPQTHGDKTFALGRPHKFDISSMKFEVSANGSCSVCCIEDIKQYIKAGSDIVFASRAQAVLAIRISQDIPKNKIKHLQHGRPISISAN